MSMKRTILLLTVASLGLAACGPTGSGGIETARQPVVARADYSFDVATDGMSVHPQEISRLSGWFDSLKVGYGDRIAIDTGGLYDPSGFQTVVSTVAARRGLLVSTAAPITNGEIPAGFARVVVSRMQASVPDCPDWSGADANFSNRQSSYYGCAMNQNLAMMVADPSDLITGKEGDGVGSSSVSTKAIDTHRKAANTGAGGLKSGGN